ncbi:hypothetical protein AB0B50_04230 [Streptomyces sp. NPDC041068]|uniref:hypothetical protein n=1 Tax=Streptomyces sp. NPDC041068 TaxID=3155130 RepID=UPI0033C80F4C
MHLGDGLVCEALAKGLHANRWSTGQLIHLAIVLPDEAVQHFERPTDGGPDSWRATTFEGRASGFTFDEPVTAEWGVTLDTLTTKNERTTS